MALICVICVAYEDQSETRFNKTTILILHSRWRPLLKARVLSQMWTYTTSLFNLFMITIKSNEVLILSNNPLQRASVLSLESRPRGNGVDHRFWLWSWIAGVDKVLDMFVKFWPPHLLSRYFTFPWRPSWGSRMVCFHYFSGVATLSPLMTSCLIIKSSSLRAL